jgi:TonB family protein
MMRKVFIILFLSMTPVAQENPSPEKKLEKNESEIEILGVIKSDAGPYLKDVVERIRKNWYPLIPKVARPPKLKQGTVTISFKIARDGTLSGMKLDHRSGDVALDRAAWGALTSSRFDKFPSNLTEESISLRFSFRYNSQRELNATTK